MSTRAFESSTTIAAPDGAGAARAASATLVFHAVRDGEIELASAWRRWRLDPDLTLALDAEAPLRVLRGPAAEADWLRVEAGPATCASARARAGLGPQVPLGGHLLANDATLRACWRAVAQQRAGADVAARLAVRAAAARAAWESGSRAFTCTREATRRALLERILIATDYIAGHYDEALDLDAMARAASLSRFHFVRCFRAVHGTTPHAWLVQRRATVARRRLAAGDDVAEAAARAGFGSRSTLFRHLRADARQTPCCPSV